MYFLNGIYPSIVIRETHCAGCPTKNGTHKNNYGYTLRTYEGKSANEMPDGIYNLFPVSNTRRTNSHAEIPICEFYLTRVNNN